MGPGVMSHGLTMMNTSAPILNLRDHIFRVPKVETFLIREIAKIYYAIIYVGSYSSPMFGAEKVGPKMQVPLFFLRFRV